MIASTGSPRALVDTNVVVHAYDVDAPGKHDIARALLRRLSDEGRLSSSPRFSTSSAR